MGDVSVNFSLSEFCVSQTAARQGRRIIPDKKEKNALILLIRTTMQPVRELVGCPIIITSGLRPKWLNDQIGGSKNSQHIKGQAADFVVPGWKVLDVAKLIAESDIPYDQLIYEFDDWIHISCPPGPAIRHQVLTAKSMDGETVYFGGIAA